MEETRIECVGAVVTDASGRMLLVRRGREPAVGMWSIPGGKVEPDESLHEAARREVFEETALDVTVGTYVGTVELPAPTGGVFVIHDFVASPSRGVDAGAVTAGDDADEVGWFTPAEVRALDAVPGLVEALEGWDLLPQR